MFEQLAEMDVQYADARFPIGQLARVAAAGGEVVINVLSSTVSIPDFAWFCKELEVIFQKVATNNEGWVDDSIPLLAHQDPSKFAISVCSVNGQRFSFWLLS